MGPVVVITGASAGVGRATARLFAERDGARIGLIARGRERLEAAADEVRQSGGEALALPCDVADAAGVEQAAEKVERAFGPIDIWVNCAMATMMAPVGKMTPEEFRRVTEVTYLGSVHGTTSALHRMRQRDRGVIVQVGSALAYRSIPLQSAYCGAKHGIVGFLDSLRSELIHDKSHVRLSVVHLPAVNTPQFSWMRNRMPRRPQPVPPIFQPEVAADAIHFAAHHPRREFWVGRSSVQAIMAQRIAPGVLDRFLARTGFDAQQTGEPDSADRPDNLFALVEGEYAARGRFADRAERSSTTLEATKRRTPVASTAVLALGVAGLLLARRAVRHGGRS